MKFFLEQGPSNDLASVSHFANQKEKIKGKALLFLFTFRSKLWGPGVALFMASICDELILMIDPLAMFYENVS